MRIMTRSAATDPEPRYLYTKRGIAQKHENAYEIY